MMYGHSNAIVGFWEWLIYILKLYDWTSATLTLSGTPRTKLF